MFKSTVKVRSGQQSIRTCAEKST